METQESIHKGALAASKAQDQQRHGSWRSRDTGRMQNGETLFDARSDKAEEGIFTCVPSVLTPGRCIPLHRIPVQALEEKAAAGHRGDSQRFTLQPVTLLVRPRGKPIRNLPEAASLTLLSSTADLYQRLAAQSGCSVHRLRIIKGSDGSGLPNSKDVTIDRTGLRDQSTVYVKDLGPQIAWRTVFIVEYLGPLLIHPLLYLLRPYLYNNAPASPSSLQTLSLILISLHFVKRELETLFVHRFSLATMPARNIVKNSAHYWIFAGANLAYWIYAP
ncbi:hypothetical protein B0A49_11569, partial [Cryomyces minteri]